MANGLQVDFLLSGVMGTNNKPLAYGKVYTYSAGTSDEASVYTDATMTTAAANPIILDERGSANVYAAGFFKFVIKDKNDVTIETYDNLYYVVPSSEATTVTSISSTYTTTSTAELIKVNTAGGSITLNLASAVGNGGLKFIIIKTSASNTLTVDPFASETINGNATYSMTANNETLEIISDNANWIIVNTPAGSTVTISSVDSLSNKTLVAPVISGTVTGTYTLGGTPTITIASAVTVSSYEDSWALYGSDTVKYYKDPFGIVHIEGSVSDAGTSNGEVFTLNEGYRPDRTMYFGPRGTTSGATVVTVAISSAGVVQSTTDTTAQVVHFHGISFKAA